MIKTKYGFVRHIIHKLENAVFVVYSTILNLNAYPQMKTLEDRALFDSVQIDVGGYGISWNDELDLAAETIWEEGIFVRKISTDLMHKLSADLTTVREAAGMTQKQLAEVTGIYQADISKIERGIGNPSVQTLYRLAEGMGVNLQITFVKRERN